MSKIQDYNARLENNNTNLNEILNTINNLPTLKLQDKSVTPTKEKQTIQPDESYNGLGSVSVEAIPSSYVEPSGTLEITENGTYDVKNYESVTTDIKGSAEKYAPKYVAQPITFQNYTGTDLEYETSMLDTTNFTSMASMFESCSNLIKLDVSEWNTSNVTNLYSMFYRCLKLTSLVLSNFDTSNVTNMSYIFAYSSAFTSLDLSSWNTSKVTTMSNMFRSCSSLTYLDIRNFTFDSVTSYSSMFSSVPTNCLIIVKGETEKEWILTNGNLNFTNVKTVAEL